MHPFPAATTSAVDAIDIETAGGSLTRLVLRRYVDPSVLASEPRAVEREATILQTIEPIELPVPRLIASDPDGSSCGAPALLMTRVPGRARLRPRSGLDEFVDRLAAPLPVMHATRRPHDPEFPTYRPYYAGRDLSPPPWSRHPAAWERAIAVHAEPTPAVTTVLIHRDYHPGNVLWRGPRVSGIVDWAWACRGPGAVDVAHCRLNLALALGLDAADRFLSAWQARAGASDYDPWWDLRDAVDALPDLRDTAAALARLDAFVARGAARV